MQHARVLHDNSGAEWRTYLMRLAQQKAPSHSQHSFSETERDGEREAERERHRGDITIFLSVLL